MSPLAQRQVLVSGAASGIGAAIARQLAAAGAEVMGTDLRATPPSQLTADLRSQAEVDALFAAVHPRLPALDTLVLCAGTGVHERLDAGDPARWAQVLEVNVLGALRLIRAFVPQLLQRPASDVLIIGSVAARQAYPYGGVYGASKAALEAIAETLRLEVLPACRVSVIAPGVTDTPFFERAGGGQSVAGIGCGALQADEVAALALTVLAQPAGVAVSHLTVRPRAQTF